MAHQLTDFDQMCDQICTPSLRHTTSDPPDQETPLVLIEVSPDGRLNSTPIDEDFLKADIKRNSHHDSTTSSPVDATGSTIKMIHLHSVSRDHIQDGRLLPLAIDSSLFKRVAQWIRMPLIFPSVLATKTAIFIDAEPTMPESTSQTLPQASQHMSKYLHRFILQSVPGGIWSSFYAASFTYSFSSRCMYVFLLTCETESSQALRETIDLVRFASKGQSPFLIPSAIVRHHLETRVQFLDNTKGEIYHLECSMGVRRDQVAKANPLTLDFDEITRHINALNANLAWTMHSCRRIERMLDFMDTVTTRFSTSAALNNIPQAHTLHVHHQLQNSHAYLRAWNHGIADRVQYLTARLQALSQSVYSGIAQRDSATSLRMASTSAALAHTSHQVALATSRDSAVMRVITAVTVVFLPGTFTATFFSTTFFNFGAGSDGRVYSSWVWLYFVLTLGLTALVLGGTWVLWRAKEREIVRQAGEAKSG